MLVVADAGPPHYLVLSGCIDVLPKLFARIILPDTVRDELRHARAPELVRRWIDELPGWVDVAATASRDAVSAQWTIGAGERSAITLALECRANLLLIDDRRGAAAAASLGLRAVGTLGILDRAARRGLIDLDDALTRLRATNFRVRPELLNALLAQHRQ